jgi:hypothetical protein
LAILGAGLECALDALTKSFIHPQQALAAVFADDLVSGLKRAILAAGVRLGRRLRLPLLPDMDATRERDSPARG